MTFEQYNEKEALEHILQDKILSWEFANFFLGKYLGQGCSRYVFENPFDKTTVIKIDYSSYNANCLEFDTWCKIMEIKEVSKWFAPIVEMSNCGRIMLQKKCNMNFEFNDKKLELIPSFLTDVKMENFGLYKGNLVCFDYASNLLWEKGMKVKLVKNRFKYEL